MHHLQDREVSGQCAFDTVKLESTKVLIVGKMQRLGSGPAPADASGVTATPSTATSVSFSKAATVFNKQSMDSIAR